MPILDAQAISKRIGTRTLLSNVFLTVRRSERVGIVGANGSGKSTLANILAGVAEPDTGTIHRRRDARIEYLAQDPPLPPEATAEQVVFGGRPEWDRFRRQIAAHPGDTEATVQFDELGGYALELLALKLLSRLGLSDPNAVVGPMSGGEKRRIALARVLFAAPDLAILDEPTNHLDAEAIEWLEEYLTLEYQGGLILITHDRFLLNRTVSRTLEVEGGQVFSYEGGWEEYLEAREERRAQEASREANRQNFLRRELEWLRRQPKARTGKQKARIQRAESAISAPAPTETKSLALELKESRLGSMVLEVEGLKLSILGRELVRDLTFRVEKGMRLGIVGPSGSGKTTLIRTLLGERPIESGTIRQGTTVRYAYLDQMKEDLDRDATVFDAITDGRTKLRFGDQDLSAYSYLERFGFRGEAARQQVSVLSGGERARASLARLLLTEANVIVLDEPTNDLDVMTLGALEDLLMDFSGAALIVSHDRYFLDRVATHVLGLDGRGAWELSAGGFSAHIERKKELARQAQAQKPVESSAPAPEPAVKKLTYAEEKELSGLLERIEAQGELVQALEAKLANPEAMPEKPEDFATLVKALSAEKQALEALEERWLVLEERRLAAQKPKR
ncbi:MAG: hypothetical protein B6A08_16720 [Sorangiineae bacterium NIC37A_2]|nr:MAG: hypothetical protein B6A08_16720 [Sorangiineae bacterium NIC37A_2]